MFQIRWFIIQILPLEAWKQLPVCLDFKAAFLSMALYTINNSSYVDGVNKQLDGRFDTVLTGWLLEYPFIQTFFTEPCESVQPCSCEYLIRLPRDVSRFYDEYLTKYVSSEHVCLVRLIEQNATTTISTNCCPSAMTMLYTVSILPFSRSSNVLTTDIDLNRDFTLSVDLFSFSVNTVENHSSKFIVWYESFLNRRLKVSAITEFGCLVTTLVLQCDQIIS